MKSKMVLTMLLMLGISGWCFGSNEKPNPPKERKTENQFNHNTTSCKPCELVVIGIATKEGFGTSILNFVASGDTCEQARIVAKQFVEDTGLRIIKNFQ